MTDELEAKLKKKRDKWARQKRNRRAGVLNVGLRVPHYDYLLKCLIDDGWLDPEETCQQHLVCDAVDGLFRDEEMLWPHPYRRHPWFGAPRLPRFNEGTVRDFKIDDYIVGLLVAFEPAIEPMKDNKAVLLQTAEAWLHLWYSNYVFEPGPEPLPVTPRLTGRPYASKPYKEKMTANRKVSTDKREHDPIVKSHAKVAGVGFKGRHAGSQARWVVQEQDMVRSTETDHRPSTRDAEKTTAEAEKEFEKPYDNPTGIPKSFAIRSDAEPKDTKGVKRIGGRIVEDGEIEEPKKEPEE